MRIFVIEDDRGWEHYYARILKVHELEFFHDGVEVIAAMDEVVPDLVILDVLLTGPTGFAILHEMRSYPELMNVPVIVVSSVKLGVLDESYGVCKVFDKAEMTPRDLLAAVCSAAKVLSVGRSANDK